MLWLADTIPTIRPTLTYPDIRTPAPAYQRNLDYYRGKTKSVYEKESCFRDFVNNITLTENNLYDSGNLSRLKRRFHRILESKYPDEVEGAPSDPLSLTKRLETPHRPQSEVTIIENLYSDWTRGTTQ